jgi:hypothetical protein
MKRHSKGHVSSLYYSCEVESGSTWKTMQFLGHTSFKKLRPIIRFTDMSLFRTKLRLTSWFLIDCLINGLLSPI